MKYIIKKNNGLKLSSIYLNDLGYTQKYKGIDFKDADYFGFIKKPAPNKLFVFRKNSAIMFDSIIDINKTIEDSIKDIKEDNRYCKNIKKSLIKSTQNLKKYIVPVNNIENHF